jgi:hypothetical protein
MIPIKIFDLHDYDKAEPIDGFIEKVDGVVRILFNNQITMTEEEFKKYGWIYTIDEQYIDCNRDCDSCVTPIC